MIHCSIGLGTQPGGLGLDGVDAVLVERGALGGELEVEVVGHGLAA
jgi:hypothetical protein